MPKSQLTWDATWTEPITIAALTQRLYEEGAGKEDLVALLKDRDRELVERFCGPGYHPLEDARFERAGTRVRQRLGTRFGIISLNSTYNVTFNGSGLPLGTIWSVTFAGGALVSTGPSLGTLEPNGTFAFTMGTVQGYVASPREGMLVVNGVAVALVINYAAVPPSSPSAVGIDRDLALAVVLVLLIAANLVLSFPRKRRRLDGPPR